MGSVCQNEREAHLLLQLMKDCCQVTAPGVLFIAEAIVAPVEIAKYFGEDAINAKECEIAYNATFMALLWDAVATKNASLLNRGFKNLPNKLERATWLNYVRCHDDIGLGFDDNESPRPAMTRRSTGASWSTISPANFRTRQARPALRREPQDRRCAHLRLARLAGRARVRARSQTEAIDAAIKTILLHSMILSFGGIPLLYYGDESVLTTSRYLEDPTKRATTAGCTVRASTGRRRISGTSAAR